MIRLLLYIALIAAVTVTHAEDAANPFVLFHEPVLALTHAQVIDGTGAGIRDNQTIIIRGENIADIGDEKRIRIPADRGGGCISNSHRSWWRWFLLR